MTAPNGELGRFMGGICDPYEASGARFYQVVVRERIGGAAKAGRGHAVEDLPSVIARLVARAEADRA